MCGVSVETSWPCSLQFRLLLDPELGSTVPCAIVNFINKIFNDSHIGFTNGLLPYTLVNIPIYIAALKTLVGYPKSRVYAIILINENPDQNRNHPFNTR